jgi:O-antigen/teichoic acid export membrane protein
MSLVKNSTIVIFGVIVSNLLTYLFHFIAGRVLGPADYGVFGALMALFLLTALPASALGFAISKFTSRFYSENNLGNIAQLRKKIQTDVLIFSLIMLTLIILLSQIIAGFLKINSNISVIVVGIVLVFALILPVNRGVLQGMKKFQVLSWNIVIESLSRLALLVVFLYLGYGVNGAVFAYGLAYFVAFFIIFRSIKEVKEQAGFAEKIEIKPVYKFIFQVMLVNIILQSIINIPSLFIKHFFSSEFTGYWTASLSIARISLFITGSVSLVMFPEIAGEKEQSKRKKIFEKAALLVFIASLFMALLFFAMPQFLIQSLYGSAYFGAVPILKVMGFVMILIGLLQLWMDYLLAKL